MKIGLYCTVSSKELNLALATLRFAELSEYVFKIAILVTDAKRNKPQKISNKITLYQQNFGNGYNIPVADGGYNQIDARNFLIEKLNDADVDWIIMHDADDIYDISFYQFISTQCKTTDAVTCSCFSLRHDMSICVPLVKSRFIQGKTLYDSHTRAWKKSLNLKYEKSPGIEKYYLNHSRHCGVIFPDNLRISYTDGLYHFHLHALLNKRHSKKIAGYSTVPHTIPESIDCFLKENAKIFLKHR